MRSLAVPERARAFLNGSEPQPAVPPVARLVTETLDTADPTPGDLVRLISREPTLGVGILCVADAAFAAPAGLDRLADAVRELGPSHLRCAVVAAALPEVFRDFGQGDARTFEHAVGVGVAAAVLADFLAKQSPLEAYLAGLLHDVGRLSLVRHAPDQAARVAHEARVTRRPSPEVELEDFGFDHADLGRALLAHWPVRECVAVAVGAHHDLSRARGFRGAEPLAAVLQVADRLARVEGVGRRRPETIDLAACPGARELGVGPSEIPELASRFRSAWRRNRRSLLRTRR